MFSIDIATIPHAKQRYETPGDWYWIKEEDEETLVIRVSEIGNWKYEALIAFHELCEVLICRFQGVTTEQVDAFDIQYEKDRAEGKHTPDDEPGNDPACPCWFGHQVATACERMLAYAMDVDWKAYGDAVVALLPSAPEKTTNGENHPGP